MGEEAPSLLCHDIVGKLDAMLADDPIYGTNGWCGPTVFSPRHENLDRRQEDLEDHRQNARSLLDEDSIWKRQHFRILAATHKEQDENNFLSDVNMAGGGAQHTTQSDFDGVPTLAVSFTTKKAMASTAMDATTAHPSSYHSQQEQPFSSCPSRPDAVLNEAIMEELQDHLPFCKRGESFWLQYSLVRDGASLDLLLNKAQDSECTILAIETLEGEIFGAFCTKPWKHSQDYYGSGQSFLWRVEGERFSNSDDDDDDDDESDLEDEVEVQVFKFAFLNHNIQLCQPDRLVVGGGDASHHSNPPPSLAVADSASNASTCSGNEHVAATAEWGFGLWLEHDLLRGSSSPCLTFQSPSLSRIHADGSLFEIRNLEVWALTPCISVAQAEANQRQRRLLSGALVVPRSLHHAAAGIGANHHDQYRD